jgi:hypothetical protein
LNKSKNRQKIQREQEKNSFQWLLEQISDDDDAKDYPFPLPPSKKRKRPVGKKQAGGAWISDAEFDDEYDDDDAALTDDMVRLPNHSQPLALAIAPNPAPIPLRIYRAPITDLLSHPHSAITPPTSNPIHPPSD